MPKDYFDTLIIKESKRLNMSELEVVDLCRKLLSRVVPKESPVVPPNQIDLLDAIKDAERDKS